MSRVLIATSDHKTLSGAITFVQSSFPNCEVYEAVSLGQAYSILECEGPTVVIISLLFYTRLASLVSANVMVVIIEHYPDLKYLAINAPYNTAILNRLAKTIVKHIGYVYN